MNTDIKEQLNRLRTLLGEELVSLDNSNDWHSQREEPKSEWTAYSGLLGYCKAGATPAEAVDNLLASAKGRFETLATEKEQEAGRLRQAAAAVEQTKPLPFDNKLGAVPF